MAATSCEYCASLTPDHSGPPQPLPITPAPLLRLPPPYGSHFPHQLLTDAQFKQASWDYVQNTATATTKWGDIGDLDVSGVTDFSYAFSAHRASTGGSYVKNGNTKAMEFVGTAISKWITTSTTSLHATFLGASQMTAVLNKWNVAKVTTLKYTFMGATEFAGLDLGSWNTASVTTLESTFQGAIEMNADLSGWKVSKVVTLKGTFVGATNFVGTGLDLWNTASVTTLFCTFQAAVKMNADLSAWITTSVTTLFATFYSAVEMNSDLSKWSVAKVATMQGTFYGASKFVGTGLDSWITTSVTTLLYTFELASEMNVDLSGWAVGKVTTMQNAFTATTSLTSCNKRRITDAWKDSRAFVATSYDTDWEGDTCTVRFKYRAAR